MNETFKALIFALCVTTYVTSTAGCGDDTTELPPKLDSETTETDNRSSDETTGSQSEGQEPSERYARDIQPIWSLECHTCHETPSPAEDLDLTTRSSRENLVGVNSEQVPTMKLVDPGSLETSYLWSKLQDTHKSVGGDGLSMPKVSRWVGGRLSEADLAIIEQWILDGAP